MVEMCVRYVRKHVPSGSDVAVLGPAGQDERPMIALSVSRPEALELSDELDGTQTPRAAAFDLMIGILGAAGASVAGIEILDAPGQAAQARLQLTGPRGQTEVQVEVGPAVSLSVRIGAPLRVSDRLIAGMMPPSGDTPAADIPPETVRPCAITGSAGEPPARDPSSGGDILADQPVAGPAHDVPEQFRRAFDD